MFNSLAHQRRVFKNLSTIPDSLLNAMHEEWLRYKVNMPNEVNVDRQLKAIEAELLRRDSDKL